MPVVDYGHDYQLGNARPLAHVPFSSLKSGKIEINGKTVPTVPVTSQTMSLEIAQTLKSWIEKGEFLLTEPQEIIPSY
jgi:uncharacterized protein (DUF39 family)